MPVWRVPLARLGGEHPCDKLYHLLLSKHAGGHYSEAGNLRGDLRAGPPPHEPRHHPQAWRRTELRALRPIAAEIIRDIPGAGLKCCAMYPPGGGLGWHNDANHRGWRVYVVLATGPSRLLRWQLPSVEDRTATVNVFQTGHYHALQVDSIRGAIGFSCSEEYARGLMDVAEGIE